MKLLVFGRHRLLRVVRLVAVELCTVNELLIAVVEGSTSICLRVHRRSVFMVNGRFVRVIWLDLDVPPSLAVQSTSRSF